MDPTAPMGKRPQKDPKNGAGNPKWDPRRQRGGMEVRNGGRGASWGAAMGGDWGGGAQKRPTDGGGGPQNGAGVLEPEMPPKWGLTPKFHPKRPQKWELGSRISAWRHRGGMEVRNGGGWGQKWGGFGGGGDRNDPETKGGFGSPKTPQKWGLAPKSSPDPTWLPQNHPQTPITPQNPIPTPPDPQ